MKNGDRMNVLLTTLNAKYIHKNLALRYLYVTRPEGWVCEIKEFTIKDKIERIAHELLIRTDDVIGFSVYIWNVEQTKELIAMLKKQRPEVRIVIGGPEVSFDGTYFLENWDVDAVICGEGEFAFWEYLTTLGSKKAIDGVYTKDYIPAKGYAMVDLSQLEQYPNPYFLPFDEADLGKRYFYMETSRGCPYHCQYCLSSVQGRVRMFSETYVTNILNQVFQKPIRQIKFLDRTFNVDKARALRVAKYIQEHARPEQVFQFEIMAEYVGDDLISYLAAKPPFPKFRFEIGIQSTNEPTLREIQRYQNFDRLTNVIHRLQKSQESELHVDLIAGLPFETLTVFRRSFNEVFALYADEVQLGFLKLLRGTSLRSNYQKYGMEYDAQAPYEIRKTAWMSEQDLQEVHEVCFALEALYNSGRCKDTIKALLKHESHTPYQLFALLGKTLSARKYKQIDELFAQVADTLAPVYGLPYVQSLLAMEYYQLFKQKPKRFYPFQIDDEKRKQCYESLMKLGYSRNELMHYGMFDQTVYQGSPAYLFILYHKDQIYPKRYIVDFHTNTAYDCKESKYEISCSDTKQA